MYMTGIDNYIQSIIGCILPVKSTTCYIHVWMSRLVSVCAICEDAFCDGCYGYHTEDEGAQPSQGVGRASVQVSVVYKPVQKQ